VVPSLLCIVADSLPWSASVGLLEELVRRTRSNQEQLKAYENAKGAKHRQGRKVQSDAPPVHYRHTRYFVKNFAYWVDWLEETVYLTPAAIVSAGAAETTQKGPSQRIAMHGDLIWPMLRSIADLKVPLEAVVPLEDGAAEVTLYNATVGLMELLSDHPNRRRGASDPSSSPQGQPGMGCTSGLSASCSSPGGAADMAGSGASLSPSPSPSPQSTSASRSSSASSLPSPKGAAAVAASSPSPYLHPPAPAPPAGTGGEDDAGMVGDGESGIRAVRFVKPVSTSLCPPSSLLLPHPSLSVHPSS